MIITNSDGGSRGNPGEAAIGIVIRNNEKIIQTYRKKIGLATNNYAEYTALLKAMKLALKHSKNILCILDSELVVKQMNGEYKIKNKNLKNLYEKVKKIEQLFESVKYKHVSRENKFQKIADRLVNEALDR